MHRKTNIPGPQVRTATSNGNAFSTKANRKKQVGDNNHLNQNSHQRYQNGHLTQQQYNHQRHQYQNHQIGHQQQPAGKHQQQQQQPNPKRQPVACRVQQNASTGDRMRQRRVFPTNYCALLKKAPPPIPPNLIKGLNGVDHSSRKKDHPGLGKVKIMLRISDSDAMRGSAPSSPASPGVGVGAEEFLRVESNRKHVSVFTPRDPREPHKEIIAAPKVYAFDSIYTPRSTQAEVCTTGLVDVIQAVLNGADGTLFCYGQTNLGKTYALMGRDSSIDQMGLLPCAISWLYQCIGELKEQQGTRVAVSVSAIEVHGTSEKLRDLLGGYGEDVRPGSLAICEDPLMGTQIVNQSEIRASTVERAAYLLDAALAARSCSGSRDTPQARRHSHMFFTLNVTQQRADKNGEAGLVRSRLNFIDLGSCEKNLIKTPGSLALSLSSLGHVIMAIVNNSKHVPFRQSKLTCVLRDRLGNVNCRTVMLAHVSRDPRHYADTMATIQLASRIHRVLKKKNKAPNQSSVRYGVDSRIHQKHMRRAREDDSMLGSSSGMECTSGSELSCDTVVYVNRNGVAMSDRELTDNEGPPESVPVLSGPGKYPPQVLSPVMGEAVVYNVPEARVRPVQEVMSQQSHKQQQLQYKQQQQQQYQIQQQQQFRKQQQNRQQLNDISQQQQNQHRQGLPVAKVKGCVAGSMLPVRSPNPRKNSLLETSFSTSVTVSDSTPTNSPARSGNKPVKPPRSAGKAQNFTFDTSNCESNGERGQEGSPAYKSEQTPGKGPGAAQAVFGDLARSPIRKSNEPPQCDNNITGLGSNADAAAREGNTSTLTRGNVAKAALHCDRSAEAVSITNGCYEDVLVPTTSHQTAWAPNPRPEPAAVSEDPPIYENVNPKVEADPRPDSMVVNVDDRDWPDERLRHQQQQQREDDGDAVDFYCLTLTAMNPLVPLSRREFAQEIARIKRQRATSEQPRTKQQQQQRLRQLQDKVAGQKMAFVDEDATRQALRQLLEAEKTLEELVLDEKLFKPKEDFDFSDDSPTIKNNNNEWAWKLGNPVIELTDDVTDADDVEVLTEMPKLNCDYYGVNGPGYGALDGFEGPRSLAEVANGGCPNSNEPAHRHVCLYDSNSLEMNYVSQCRNQQEHQELERGQESPSRLSDRSDSPGKRVVKDSELRRRTSRPVIITKSFSREGAQLTLVKKDKGSKPTLELQITREEVKKDVDPRDRSSRLKKPSQTNRARKNGISADPHSNENKAKANDGEGQKRSKWLGLGRFSSKKSEKAPKREGGSPSKASLVSKLLTPKIRRAQSCKEPRSNRKLANALDATPKRQPDVVMVGNGVNPLAKLSGGKPVTNGILSNGHTRVQSRSTGDTDSGSTTDSTRSPSPKPLQKKKGSAKSAQSPSRFGFSRKSRNKT